MNIFPVADEPANLPRRELATELAFGVQATRGQLYIDIGEDIISANVLGLHARLPSPIFWSPGKTSQWKMRRVIALIRSAIEVYRQSSVQATGHMTMKGIYWHRL